MDGLTLNIRIHPAALSREDRVDKLRDMTKTYLNPGGMEIQYDLISSEVMRAARGPLTNIETWSSGLPDIRHILLNSAQIVKTI